jgi:hypothetical protein
MARRQATVVVPDKNRKMEKITAIAMHKKGSCCVVVTDRTFEIFDEQARRQSDYGTRGAQVRSMAKKTSAAGGCPPLAHQGLRPTAQ